MSQRTPVSHEQLWPIFRRSAISAAIFSICAAAAQAQTPLPQLDPVADAVPKYVIPLVIPPQMPKSAPTEACPSAGKCPTTDYNIAVRQFKQQILPGGIWNAVNGRGDGFNPTTVWSYGPATDTIPMGLTVGAVTVPPGVAPVPAAQSSFNYPAFTVETRAQQPTTVRWINELVTINPVTGKPYALADTRRTFLPHLLSIDRTTHFTNPERLPCANPTTGARLAGTTDCRPYVDPVTPDPRLSQPYNGPVPMVVHVHGAEVNPYSDGFAEAWWLPSGYDATGASLALSYASNGSRYDQAPSFRKNAYPGSAVFLYENAQPAATIWYHDHSLGMTANNVYTGPAGFWLVRGDYTGGKRSVVREKPVSGVLPGSAAGGRPTHPKVGTGCDPNFDAVCRGKIREIPIAIQDRSFNADGSLFYPQSRAYFEGNQSVPYLPNANSDVSPIHNPEFFGNMIVVNGTVWPTLDVAPQRYRLRLLAGADSRVFNLSIWAIPPTAIMPLDTAPTYWNDLKAVATEMPFYQIGAEQGTLPKVVKIMTGTAVQLPGNGTEPAAVCTPADLVAGTPGSNPADPNCDRALLLGPAERADVIVDFTGLPAGTRVRMINTSGDVPFGGFPIATPDLANPASTGQVMEFVVGSAVATADPSTPAASLVLSSEAPNTVTPVATRRGVLLEEDSKKICVTVSATGTITVVGTSTSPQANPAAYCASLVDPVTNAPYGAIPFGPTEVFVDSAVLDPTTGGVLPAAQRWSDQITQAPTVGDTEIWEIYNFTVDAHPMHLHGARFQVVNRQDLAFDPMTGAAVPAPGSVPALPHQSESGYKDTLLALPAQVTRFKAKFEMAGLYVWHCHIVEHEDNEMMVPFCVKNAATDTTCNAAPGGKAWPIVNSGAGVKF